MAVPRDRGVGANAGIFCRLPSSFSRGGVDVILANMSSFRLMDFILGCFSVDSVGIQYMARKRRHSPSTFYAATNG